MAINSNFNISKISQWSYAETSIAPLVVFRILFGLMMFVGTLRFLRKGWIYDFFIQPDHFFHYYGFEWVKPIGEFGMYTIFGLLLISSLNWYFRSLSHHDRFSGGQAYPVFQLHFHTP